MLEILENPPANEASRGKRRLWFVTVHKAKVGLCKPNEKLVAVIDQTGGACLAMGLVQRTEHNAEFNVLIRLAASLGTPSVLLSNVRELQSVLVMVNGRWGNGTEIAYSGGGECVNRVFRSFCDLLNDPSYDPDLPTGQINQLIDDWRRRYNDASRSN